MNNALETFNLEHLNKITSDDVQRHLSKQPGHFSIDRLFTLISPAATDHLEQMATQARQLTIQRFGRTIQLYAPLYVSNVCINSCLYCGYNCNTKTKRSRLTIDQAVADADVIAAEGFRHILIVAGEDPEYITVEYLCELAAKLKKKFSSISIEIYPMTTEQYKQCFDAGIDGVTLYQETYNKQVYSKYHPAGPKSDYDYRLASHDRTAQAGMRRLGIAALLGLNDWRSEIIAMAQHADYLIKKYWRSQVSFSFPRIRPAENTDTNYDHLVSDTDLVQMICALRLCFADAGIVLSTRESAILRDSLINICVTRISAGSKTNPGGYSDQQDSLEQFKIDDDRTPAEISKVIAQHGYEPVWKDWDVAFSAGK
jgi:2-iminoacetate synthase